MPVAKQARLPSIKILAQTYRYSLWERTQWSTLTRNLNHFETFVVGTRQGKSLLSSFLRLLSFLSFLSLSLSLSVSPRITLSVPRTPHHFVFSSFSLSLSLSLSLAWFSFPVLSFKMALIMNLNESFWQSSKKKRKLNHSSWICTLALLQRRGWRRPTPRVHISTTSLITRTRSCW